MKVLICEANATTALHLWWLLHEQGHSICGTAKTSAMCMEKVTTTRPDLVMVDADLRGENGPAGLSVVEELTMLGVPSVILSEGTGQVPPSSSAKAVLPRPFKEAHLVSAITRVERSGQMRGSIADAPVKGWFGSYRP